MLPCGSQLLLEVRPVLEAFSCGEWELRDVKKGAFLFTVFIQKKRDSLSAQLTLHENEIVFDSHTGWLWEEVPGIRFIADAVNI